MISTKFLISVVVLLLSNTESYHKYYLGLTEINYAEKSRTYQISIKLFTDDINLAISEELGTEFSIGSNLSANNDSLLFAYVKNHFWIADTTGIKIELHEIGWEPEHDLTWIYMESKPGSPISPLKVFNDLLVRQFEEQKHVVNLTQNGEINSVLLSKHQLFEIMQP